MCRIKKQVRTVLKQGSSSAWVIAKVAGPCVSVACAVTPCNLFFRHLYRLLSTRSSWNDILYLNDDCLQELHWWLEAMDECNFQEIKPQPIDIQVETDASSYGWGAKLWDLEAKGDRNRRVSCQSSNCRELLPVLLALIAFRTVLQGRHVQILTMCALRHT